MSDFSHLLLTRARSNPSAPVVTWYGAAGERSELSGVTFATSVAKTAGLLTDELETEPGDTIALLFGMHWQLPVWLAAADIAGLRISNDRHAPADVAVVGAAADAVPTGMSQVTVVTSLTAFGLPGEELPEPLVDHAREAMRQPDEYPGEAHEARLAWSAGASIDLTMPDIVASTRARAAEWGMHQGGRLLCQLPADHQWAPLAVWTVPLLLDGSVVIAPPDSDGDHVMSVEEATARVGVR